MVPPSAEADIPSAAEKDVLAVPLPGRQHVIFFAHSLCALHKISTLPTAGDEPLLRNYPQKDYFYINSIDGRLRSGSKLACTLRSFSCIATKAAARAAAAVRGSRQTGSVT